VKPLLKADQQISSMTKKEEIKMKGYMSIYRRAIIQEQC
jgi:hypothetical protein